MRARWRKLPEHHRWLITIGIQLAVSVLLWLLDHGLATQRRSSSRSAGCGTCPRSRGGSPPRPESSAVFGSAGSPARRPARSRLCSCSSSRSRGSPRPAPLGALPLVAVADRRRLPVHRLAPFTIPVFQALPGRPDRDLHARVHDDGGRPQHRRRLRGAARPRLRAFYAIGATPQAGSPRAVREPMHEPAFRDRQLPGLVGEALPARRDRRPARHRRHPPLGLPRDPDRRRDHRGPRDPDRASDPATPGDYLAIVTLGFGEILRRSRATATDCSGYNATNGPNGITPIDSPGFGHHLSNLTGGILPAYFLNIFHTTIWPTIDRRPVFSGPRSSCSRFTVFCSLRLRLAPRPGLDRDPRGRDGGGRDGRAADEDEDVGICGRRVLRRHRRRLLRRARADVPRRLLTSTSRCSFSAW